MIFFFFAKVWVQSIFYQFGQNDQQTVIFEEKLFRCSLDGSVRFEVIVKLVGLISKGPCSLDLIYIVHSICLVIIGICN